MSSNADCHDWGLFWRANFPDEEMICEQLNDPQRRCEALNVAFTYVDPELATPTRHLLERYRLPAHPADVDDFKQKGWVRCLAKIKRDGISWEGPGTLFRVVYGCIQSAARQAVREEEIPRSPTEPPGQGATGDARSASRTTQRVRIEILPVVDDPDTASESVFDRFSPQIDFITELENDAEKRRKLQLFIDVLCAALCCLEGKFARQACIMWFFMGMTPTEIARAWGATIHQGRLRLAKLSFVEHILELLDQARATCEDTDEVDFLSTWSDIVRHFRDGDASDGDLNQHHPLVRFLRSLVSPTYEYAPRARDAFEAFIDHLHHNPPQEW